MVLPPLALYFDAPARGLARSRSFFIVFMCLGIYIYLLVALFVCIRVHLGGGRQEVTEGQIEESTQCI